MKPNYTLITKLNPADEIIPGLWQGMAPREGGYRGFDLAISCEKYLRRQPFWGFEGDSFHVPMEDDDHYPIPEMLVQEAAERAHEVLGRGGKVLIHCTGGLNRSSIVTVEVLVLTGVSRRDAVDLLRDRRDQFCLCNRAFEKWALRP